MAVQYGHEHSHSILLHSPTCHQGHFKAWRCPGVLPTIAPEGLRLTEDKKSALGALRGVMWTRDGWIATAVQKTPLIPLSSG